MSDTTQAPFTLADGLNLAVYDWPLPLRWRPRAVLLVVHGLGEHAWRYDPLAQRLNEWGFCVRAYDQRGHGESGGARGVIPSDTVLLDDLAEVVDDTRRHIAQPWACPLIVLGHSMGGLVASTFVQRNMAPLDGLILSSPALDTGLGPFKKKLVRWLCRWAPNLTLGNGLDPSKISHSPAVVAAYMSDRLVHDRISARLACFIDSNGPRVVAAARRWPVPTLLMYAGADRLVSTRGSRAFAAAAPRDKVTSRCFDGCYHEIFNEPDPSAVYGMLRAWLDQRVPA
ncbi:MAG: lysophospholipase [Hydrogenophaga sp.]|uniref:alpha/beta hydrolase n=1 Tax=Hydrogenophaga sp. TaxID=1904254 RepID=UPI002731CFB4|nr:alpha/beta hydrolase [Hydrogenophaga sp.]MDP2164238.1 lysophospholipase [Hydrogenophaga sp.]MDP3475649.1 lysophospholipase [Hydrogenophaga sp.]